MYKTTIAFNKFYKVWGLRDNDGYLISCHKTPAEARRGRRQWYLYLTLADAERANDILCGRISVK